MSVCSILKPFRPQIGGQMISDLPDFDNSRFTSLHDADRFFENIIYLADLVDCTTPDIPCGSGYSDVIWRRFEGDIDI